MAWYKAYQTLSRHPKTLKLARLLKVDRRYAVGLLHDLFAWGLDAAGKYGELIGVEAEDIALALDISGKKGTQTVEALMEAGFLELNGNVYAIHDWYDYSGNLAERREKDRIRKRGNSDGIPQEIRGNECGIPSAKSRVDKSREEKTRVDNNYSILSEERKKEKKERSAFPTADADLSQYRLTNPGVFHYMDANKTPLTQDEKLKVMENWEVGNG